MNRFLLISLVVFFSLCCSINSVEAQLKFNYESTGFLEVDNAIDSATEKWSSKLQDDISVNLNFDFTLLGKDRFAGTSVHHQVVDYSTFSNAIGGDITSNIDSSFFGAMPTGPTFSVYISHTVEAGGSDHSVPYVDDNGGLNNSIVSLSSANAKALGLRDPDDQVLDATIMFNGSYNWDYDPSDGIDSHAKDFVGIATHEIGHALGFISGIDNLLWRVRSESGEGRIPSDDALAFVSSLDFMRHSEESYRAGADLDWSPDSRDKYFSTDGAGGGSDWSTSEFHGDGEQASHWKKGKNLGIMDPNAIEGGLYDVTSFDFRALDAIGYDLDLGGASVPEPSGLALAFLLLVPALQRRRTSNFA